MREANEDGARTRPKIVSTIPAGAGLCLRCRHARPQGNDRGSVFLRCALAARDDRFPKYPTLPVLDCEGYQAEVEPGRSKEPS